MKKQLKLKEFEDLIHSDLIRSLHSTKTSIIVQEEEENSWLWVLN